MADPNFKKISLMAEKTTIGTNDFVPIADMDEPADVNKNKKIKTSNLRKGITNAELAGSITIGKLANFSAPAADAILFYDKSAEATPAADSSVAYLTPSTGVQIIETNLSTKDSEIVHDNLSGFVADEHVAHTGVTITAGAGLSGGGTIAANRTLALSHLGIESLADPNADRIMFWDDSAGAMKFLTPGSGLQIADTTLNAAAISGTEIADGAVAPAKTSFFNSVSANGGVFPGFIFWDGSSIFLPSGWSSERFETGKYRITHSLNTIAYIILITSAGENIAVASIQNIQANYVDIWMTAADTETVVDSAFHFILIRYT